MRIKHIAFTVLLATALAGCNDTLDSSSIDLKSVKNKVEHPLPSRIIAEMKKKDMPRNSPIMIRILKEEGILEVWKAKSNGRFDVIRSYEICAWSGKLGPKVKEGDRQAPEGFYDLTQAHLNPNSKYYLAINTGFPNRYDQANARTGSNLMIHGACSSSGCYSMTDEQVQEIYAFARDAFRGGQTSVQLQAFPFRMTAENMARHRNNPNFEFWKMIKAGYDNFEVTKRPPEVNICEKKYVFNQQASGSFNAAASCPTLSTPPALASALSSYNKTYQVAYQKALDKYENKIWYEPSEAERKAIVADKRKGRDLAYAPTGSSLEAGRLMTKAEFDNWMEKRAANGRAAPRTSMVASGAPTSPRASSAAERMAQGSPAGDRLTTATVQPAQGEAVPVPAENSLAYTAAPPAPANEKKPFWKFWDEK